MRQRLAIAISGLVAAAVLAVGLTAAGFAPESRSVAAEVPDVTPVESVERVDELEPEVVYVKPAPEPKTVIVTKRAKSATKSKKNTAASRNTRQVRAARSDDDDHRAEERREASKERREREREDREDHEDEDD
jgi:ABC-type antimicrobial peptide transport system permease subunit